MPRKAVAPKKAVEIERQRMPIMLAVILIVGIGLTAGAVMWGRSDNGQIDVSATIANSQFISDNAADSTASPVGIAAQEFVDMPNGGLVASGIEETPPSQPVAEEVNASSTATTTTESIETEPTEEETVGEPTSPVVPEGEGGVME